jgi:hypothetical protein
MKASDIIDELKTFYKVGVEYHSLDRRLAEADVARWSKLCGLSRPQLFDQIAMRLALGYNASELSFEFCDMVVNDFAGPVSDTSGPRPPIFWEVYSAFDEGEYYHGCNRDEDPVEVYTRTRHGPSSGQRSCNRDEDPVEVYTRPMIARIVEAISSAQRDT